MSIKIFVINLETSVERRKIMERQLTKQQLDFEIFKAVRGSALSEEELLMFYDKEYLVNKPAWFTPGAAGCAISHYLLYKKIIDEKIDVALILEDDMQLPGNLAGLLQQLSTAIRGDEVIMLFYQSYAAINLSSQTARPMGGGTSLYQIIDINRLRSTGAYMINYNAAKRMVDSLLPFSAFPDDWKGFYERRILNGIRVVYPLVFQNTYEPTTISPNTKGGAFIKKAVQAVETYKVFPLYQILKNRRKKNILDSQRCFILDKPAQDFRAP